jgi:UDP-N-acetylmuramoyl-tripeptide--D-alanyl-D-alanine ligase
MPTTTDNGARPNIIRAPSMVGIQEESLENWRDAAKRLLRPLYRRTVLRIADVYRRKALRRVTFVGVTGSCGKTTTKELITAVLASHFRVRKNPGNSNLPISLAKTIVKVRPWDDLCVLEIAAAIGGERIALEVPLSLVQPHIGVVTNVQTDHIGAFGTVQAIAAEKGKLIAALTPHGTAILNADDPHVLAMAGRCSGRVFTYGQAPDAIVRAEEISSSWPERLSFNLCYADQVHAVRTQLCGRNLMPCVLAALAVGLARGVPLEKAVEAVQALPPLPRRMEPIEHPDGVTFIRDDFKAPLWSIPAALQFMREARARRKVVVIGTISDFPEGSGNRNRVYASVAREALEVADHVIFVGPHARRVLRARGQPGDSALQAFYAIEAASEYLRGLLQPGDVVLLKDSNCEDLGKIIRARRREASGYPASTTQTAPAAGAGHPTFAVVGIGNPGEIYKDTPHNVGQRALDRLADTLGGQWTRQDQALVAQVERQGTPLYLIKPLTPVNFTGRVVFPLARHLGVEPTTCVLVHDDIDMALGAVRGRMNGSDGGHRGVRSVLEAFRTDDVPRVKIGVGRSRTQQVTGHVLAPFAPAERSVIDKACADAADRVLELVDEVKRSAAM